MRKRERERGEGRRERERERKKERKKERWSDRGLGFAKECKSETGHEYSNARSL